MDGSDWAAVVGSANDAALDWYAITHNLPLPSARPTSAMDVLVGEDFGSPRAGLAGGATLIVLAVIVVAAVVLLKK
jgi:hypothetical protein